jgi:hypothetical protein
MVANGRNRESGWMSPATTSRSHSLYTTDRNRNQVYAVVCSKRGRCADVADDGETQIIFSLRLNRELRSSNER